MSAQFRDSSPLIHIEHLTLNLPSNSPLDAVILPFSREPKKPPTIRFELSADGMYVTDHKLGVMWARDESSETHDFAGAEKYAADCRLGGFDDWRLPDEQELQAIRDLTRHEPAIDVNVFKSNSSYIWTCTPCSWNTSCVFAVGFYGGGVYGCRRNDRCFVRPVRFARQ